MKIEKIAYNAHSQIVTCRDDNGKISVREFSLSLKKSKIVEILSVDDGKKTDDKIGVKAYHACQKYGIECKGMSTEQKLEALKKIGVEVE